MLFSLLGPLYFVSFAVSWCLPRAQTHHPMGCSPLAPSLFSQCNRFQAPLPRAKVLPLTCWDFHLSRLKRVTVTVCLIPPTQCGRSTPRTGEWCGVECTLVGVWGCVYTDWSLLEVDHPTEARVLHVLGHFV